MAVDRALEIDIDHGDAWHVLGRVELELANFEEAATAFSKATDRDPQHVWAFNNHGYALIQIERFAEAVEPLRIALERGGDEAVFYNNLGVALERTGEPILAAMAYGRALILGHDAAENSFDRVEQIAIAHGGPVPSLDDVETLDALTLAARVAEAVDGEVDVEVALEEAEREIEFDATSGVVPVEFPPLEAHR